MIDVMRVVWGGFPALFFLRGRSTVKRYRALVELFAAKFNVHGAKP